MFILAGVSGILISKELFKFGYRFIWRYIHIFSSTFSLLLLGIHVGLHIKMIIHTMKNYFSQHIIFVRILSSLVVIILGLGIYGITLSQNRNSLNNSIKTENISVITLLKDTVNIQESLEENSKNEMDDGHENNKKNEQKHEEKDGFNIKLVVIISMGFLSVIILCAIITYIIEYKIIKRLAKK
jgi:predicted PurR-regulated permease PerM